MTAEGAALLDKVIPGWASRIDVQKFTIESTKNCILGQLFGDMEKGFLALGLKTEHYRHAIYRYGFAASTIGGLDKNLKQLTHEWLVEINRRIPSSVCESAACF